MHEPKPLQEVVGERPGAEDVAFKRLVAEDGGGERATSTEMARQRSPPVAGSGRRGRRAGGLHGGSA